MLRHERHASSAWLPTIKKLRHEVEHHVDEEERAVFPLARTLFNEDRAVDMAEDFEKRKRAKEKNFS